MKKKVIRNAKGISNKEVKAVAELEFHERRYFKREDIQHLFKNNKEMTNTLYGLTKKGRIVRLNKNKYYLVPLKARLGKWTDDPFIVIDETMDGKDYVIGDWAAANYWRLTEQIPFRYDVYTTRRQGTYTLLGIRVVFHRTSKEKLKRAVTQRIKNHQFLILNKRKMKQWMKQKE